MGTRSAPKARIVIFLSRIGYELTSRGGNSGLCDCEHEANTFLVLEQMQHLEPKQRRVTVNNWVPRV